LFAVREHLLAVGGDGEDLRRIERLGDDPISSRLFLRCLRLQYMAEARTSCADEDAQRRA
jgi:hypothetical protein